jgi:hypothetical protein
VAAGDLARDDERARDGVDALGKPSR